MRIVGSDVAALLLSSARTSWRCTAGAMSSAAGTEKSVRSPAMGRGEGAAAAADAGAETAGIDPELPAPTSLDVSAASKLGGCILLTLDRVEAREGVGMVLGAEELVVETPVPARLSCWGSEVTSRVTGTWSDAAVVGTGSGSAALSLPNAFLASSAPVEILGENGSWECTLVRFGLELDRASSCTAK